jgi:hypothetical protein
MPLAYLQWAIDDRICLTQFSLKLGGLGGVCGGDLDYRWMVYVLRVVWMVWGMEVRLWSASLSDGHFVGEQLRELRMNSHTLLPFLVCLEQGSQPAAGAVPIGGCILSHR